MWVISIRLISTLLLSESIMWPRISKLAKLDSSTSVISKSTNLLMICVQTWCQIKWVKKGRVFRDTICFHRWRTRRSLAWTHPHCPRVAEQRIRYWLSSSCWWTESRRSKSRAIRLTLPRQPMLAARRLSWLHLRQWGRHASTSPTSSWRISFSKNLPSKSLNFSSNSWFHGHLKKINFQWK